MAVKLNEYNKKRNFIRTLEPEGIPEGMNEGIIDVINSQEKLRFVVQHHLARRDHYDLRLEWGGALLSWAVPRGPSYNTRDKRLAVHVEDHPLAYRNFEGTIPKGEYGGGVVMLWDEGIWEPYLDVEEGLRAGMLKFVLKGRRLKGKWALVRIKGKAGERQDNWLLLKEKDEYIQEADGVSQYITSIRTGRSMAEIEKGEEEKFAQNPFDRTEVQLATLMHQIPEGKDWLYELKYDGYRILAYTEGYRVRLMTRNGHDFTVRFQEVADSLIDWADGGAMVLDGEMVITDSEGKSDFQALQNYLKKPRGKNLTYIIFDLLALGGEDLRGRPLTERKETLEELMRDAPSNLHYSRHVAGQGGESFAAACRAGMEGIIGKKADSTYRGGRRDEWIKLKCEKRQEFVIGGYTLSSKKTSGMSSLLLGIYEEQDLIYAGRAGTGFTERVMRELEDKFEAIRKKDSPFKYPPKARSGEKITWLEPEMVAEIKFAEWTEEQQLRQASFKGLRIDKNPRDIRREKGVDEILHSQSREEFDGGVLSEGSFEKGKNTMKSQRKDIITELTRSKIPASIGGGYPRAAKSSMDSANFQGGLNPPLKEVSFNIEGIKISNPNKVIFTDPETTKLDVVRYYHQIAERMLPYVGNRILSIVRCPKGVAQVCFYKKHPGPGSKGIVTIPIITSDGDQEEYFYIEDSFGLVGEAQMGTLEFHIWGSRVGELEKPDMMVFDLDPDEGMDLATVRQGVRDIRSILTQLSLNSYLKTSGGKGYHVVVPLKPAVSWGIFHDFAKGVAQVMEQKWPDRYTSNVRKAKRTNKIFIDWIRNARGATSIAPYSLRAREGAKVSMPIPWEELDTVAPDGIDMGGALRRMEGKDPWEDFFRNEQWLR